MNKKYIYGVCYEDDTEVEEYFSNRKLANEYAKTLPYHPLIVKEEIDKPFDRRVKEYQFWFLLNCRETLITDIYDDYFDKEEPHYVYTPYGEGPHYADCMDNSTPEQEHFCCICEATTRPAAEAKAWKLYRSIVHPTKNQLIQYKDQENKLTLEKWLKIQKTSSNYIDSEKRKQKKVRQ